MTLLTMIMKMSEGLGKTCAIFFLTILFSLPLGMLITLLRMSKNKVVSSVTRFVIAVLRGTPLMLQLLAVTYGPYYLFGTAVAKNKLIPVVIAFAINYAAYFAEIYRGGIESIDPGQAEAARSLGLSQWQAMRKVVFPQGIKNAIPALTNELIINIKDSSVLCVVGVSDLMFMTRSVAGIYYKGTECYLIAAIVYLFLTYLSSLLLKAITGKMTAPDNTKRHQGNQTVDLGLPSSN